MLVHPDLVCLELSIFLTQIFKILALPELNKHNSLFMGVDIGETEPKILLQPNNPLT